MKNIIFGTAALCGVMFAATCATAAPINIQGIDFPQGEASFADAVVSSDFGTIQSPTDNLDAANVIGLPDNIARSLGTGGNIVVQFIDNRLTSSGTSEADLFVFEVGPVRENTDIEVSENGVDFLFVTRITGATSLIDIDQAVDRDATDAFDANTQFAFVRITDSGNNDSGNVFVGADIDAVGAISSVAAPDMPPVVTVSEPATFGLMMVGLAVVARQRRQAVQRL